MDREIFSFYLGVRNIYNSTLSLKQKAIRKHEDKEGIIGHGSPKKARSKKGFVSLFA